MNEVLDDIKNNTIKNIYFFYGKEKYLGNFYIKRLFESILNKNTKDLNYDMFDDKTANIERISESMETLPVFADKRVVYLKNIGLFEKKMKLFTEKLTEMMKKISNTTCLIIEEENLEKGQREFNDCLKNLDLCRIVNCEIQKESILVKWIQKKFTEKGKSIDLKTATYLLRKIGTDMNNIMSEIEKLSSFKISEKGIYLKDIDEVCIESIDSKIFDLLDQIGRKNVAKAMEIYTNLIHMQEPVQRILYMITKQFMLISDTKMLVEDGQSADEISKLTASHKFVIVECKKQADMFTSKDLKGILNRCLEIDLFIKKGIVDSKLAVEILILETARK
ncbi:MAG TPA: DNA polymerase III subunit delta [Clostridiales bacterium]|nr:MAG: DNA polymerase III subunit delta [Clostridiales bacterium GWD2_32_59]HAN09298.1 DNA polymerase III subunit delta [Clostridiales bacterium]